MDETVENKEAESELVVDTVVQDVEGPSAGEGGESK